MPDLTDADLELIDRLASSANATKAALRQATLHGLAAGRARAIEDQRKEIEVLRAVATMLDAVVEGAQEEYVRVPYGASNEDVVQINDWHKMAKEARQEFAALNAPAVS
jgi:hypothetical protein